jgi:hypothetical protein
LCIYIYISYVIHMLSYIYICTLKRVDPPKSLNIDVPITAFSSSASQSDVEAPWAKLLAASLRLGAAESVAASGLGRFARRKTRMMAAARWPAAENPL